MSKYVTRNKLMDADEQKRFDWIKNVYGDWEEHAFMIKQVELAQAKVERLKGENIHEIKVAQEACRKLSTGQQTIDLLRIERDKLREALEGVSGNLVPGYGLCWCFKDRLDTSAIIHESICKAATEALKSNEEGDQNAG